MWGHVADVASESSLTGCIDVSEECQSVQAYKFTPTALLPLSRTVPTCQECLAARGEGDTIVRFSFGCMQGKNRFWGQNPATRNIFSKLVFQLEAKKEKGPLRAFGKVSFGVLIIQHTPNKWASFLEAPLPLGNRRSILVARDQPEDHMANPFAASKN
ncbi:hypothetical protein HZH66_002230 [Vespula vulgaris]|uniref:Uncharacterized protein n=1 Tax=Vespula vulgaris TaxID=7454 RepID=A0A834KJH8_VESVU|nr:hypothetical protein HZH66_002230 [Vespula vulgaris]